VDVQRLAGNASVPANTLRDMKVSFRQRRRAARVLTLAYTVLEQKTNIRPDQFRWDRADAPGLARRAAPSAISGEEGCFVKRRVDGRNETGCFALVAALADRCSQLAA
jgi:hypothetical protein